MCITNLTEDFIFFIFLNEYKDLIPELITGNDIRQEHVLDSSLDSSLAHFSLWTSLPSTYN